MATYTIELREITQEIFPERERYPIFDEGHRLPLNKKIIDHYWYREIGTETVDMFIFMINRKMREIMPFYNQLYISTQMKFDPLLTTDMQTLMETHEAATRESNGESTSETDNDSKSRAVSSQMPQTALAGNEDYADSATDSVSKTEGNATATESSNLSSVGDGTANTSTRGRQGSASVLLMEWRAAMLNVDMMVINELEPLFMQIWNNGDLLGGYDVPGIIPGMWRYPL